MVVLGRYADALRASIDLACDLIVAGFDAPAVLDVAALYPDTTWRDAAQTVEDMLGYLGFAVPAHEDARWLVILRAFGFSDLPIAEFYSPFLRRLPAWDAQSELERALMALLDDLDHATEPPGKEAVVARMREVVREALG